MTRRSGSADLPLHGGRVPAWLATRMAALGRVIVEALIHHYGRDELLRRLAHPFWFQSFGAVMGMDWHSSGITTSVLGALKRGLAPLQQELGLYVCGGRGRHSRRTPDELAAVGERTGLDAAALARTSRLVAKVDSAAVQDGFELYLHGFILGADGHWCVVQQGMNTGARQARRYHWLSEGLASFLDDPHAAIAGENCGAIVNLADGRAAASRAAALQLVHAGPERAVSVLRQCQEHRRGDRVDPPPQAAPGTTLDLFTPMAPRQGQVPSRALPSRLPHWPAATAYWQPPTPHLQMPAHHEVRAGDVDLRRLHATLAAAAERGPRDFCDLLLVPGVGARTVAALALVAQLVHGAPSRFQDPARFSFAHGGKDGHPFPVPLRVYDETLRVMKDALARARLGNSERLAAIRRLDQQARVLEQVTEGASFGRLLQSEREHSPQYGGRTVFGPALPR